MKGIEALGSAIATMSDVNMDSELTKSFQIVTAILSISKLSVDWSKQWSDDSLKYFTDSLNVLGDPGASATAAADYALYQQHLQQGQTEIGSQNNILQSNKSVLKGLGNAMDQVYSLMQAPMQFVKALNRAILAMGN